MSINIPGNAFNGISALGAKAPDAGYYEVSLVELANPSGRPGKRRLYMTFDNGYKCFDFMNFPFDDNGNPLPGLKENQVRGQLAATKGILMSLGYTGQDIETAAAITDEWFLTAQNGGRKAYVEFTPGQAGVQGSYNKFSWKTKAQYDSAIAAGTKVVTATAAPAVATTAAPNPVAAPVNGAPTGHATLPPPPSAAQTIVS